MAKFQRQIEYPAERSTIVQPDQPRFRAHAGRGYAFLSILLVVGVVQLGIHSMTTQTLPFNMTERFAFAAAPATATRIAAAPRSVTWLNPPTATVQPQATPAVVSTVSQIADSAVQSPVVMPAVKINLNMSIDQASTGMAELLSLTRQAPATDQAGFAPEGPEQTSVLTQTQVTVTPTEATPVPVEATPVKVADVPPAVSASIDASAPALNAIAYAKAQLGKDYVWGAAGPNTFDCSGLVMAAYRYAGMSLPRTADQQLDAGYEVYNLLPGDLVFALDPTDPNYYPGERASHVGIWDGNYIINAANPEDGIIRDTFSYWWRSHFVGVRRIPHALDKSDFTPSAIPAPVPAKPNPPRPATATPKPQPTATPKPQPTATKVPPTATPVPQPTATPEPPTATPVPVKVIPATATPLPKASFNNTIHYEGSGATIKIRSSYGWTNVVLRSTIAGDQITLTGAYPTDAGYEWVYKVTFTPDKSLRTFTFWSNGALVYTYVP